MQKLETRKRRRDDTTVVAAAVAAAASGIPAPMLHRRRHARDINTNKTDERKETKTQTQTQHHHKKEKDKHDKKDKKERSREVTLPPLEHVDELRVVEEHAAIDVASALKLEMDRRAKLKRALAPIRQNKHEMGQKLTQALHDLSVDVMRIPETQRAALNIALAQSHGTATAAGSGGCVEAPEYIRLVHNNKDKTIKPDIVRVAIDQVLVDLTPVRTLLQHDMDKVAGMSASAAKKHTPLTVTRAFFDAVRAAVCERVRTPMVQVKLTNALPRGVKPPGVMEAEADVAAAALQLHSDAHVIATATANFREQATEVHESVDACKPLLDAYFDRVAKTSKKKLGDSVCARIDVGDASFRLVRRIAKHKTRIGIGRGGVIDAALRSAMVDAWNLPVVAAAVVGESGNADTDRDQNKDKDSDEDDNPLPTIDALEHLAKAARRRAAFADAVIAFLTNLPITEKTEVKLYSALVKRKTHGS